MTKLFLYMCVMHGILACRLFVDELSSYIRKCSSSSLLLFTWPSCCHQVSVTSSRTTPSSLPSSPRVSSIPDLPICQYGVNMGRSGMEETAPATVLLTPSSFLPTLSWTASNFLFVTFPPVRHTLHDCMF